MVSYSDVIIAGEVLVSISYVNLYSVSIALSLQKPTIVVGLSRLYILSLQYPINVSLAL